MDLLCRFQNGKLVLCVVPYKASTEANMLYLVRAVGGWVFEWGGFHPYHLEGLDEHFPNWCSKLNLLQGQGLHDLQQAQVELGHVDALCHLTVGATKNFFNKRWWSCSSHSELRRWSTVWSWIRSPRRPTGSTLSGAWRRSCWEHKHDLYLVLKGLMSPFRIGKALGAVTCGLDSMT